MGVIKWSDDDLIADAKRFETRKEWSRNSGSAYVTARNRGLLNVCCAHMTQVRNCWTDETLIDAAKRFNTRKEWKAAAAHEYDAAYKRGILDVCCAHMHKFRTRWTTEMLIADAARFETKNEWRINSEGAYSAAVKRGLMHLCCTHMYQGIDYWTEEMLAEDAKRFSTRSEWALGSSGAYSAARDRKLLDSLCSHMHRVNGTDNDAIYIWKALGWTYNGEQVYKVGVTSARLGTQRINKVCQRVDVEAEIVVLAKVNCKATELESTLKSIGHDPKYVDFDGCTEFRAMSDDQLKQALALIAQAAQETIDEESDVTSEQE